jgi:hypothetical protein
LVYRNPVIKVQINIGFARINEVNDGKTVILCSKVVLNSKTKAEIKAPTKGKKSQKNLMKLR